MLGIVLITVRHIVLEKLSYLHLNFGSIAAKTMVAAPCWTVRTDGAGGATPVRDQ